jgi:hypothetical protein
MDWRLAGDYAFTTELDAAGWAWQFLRRCPEYRDDYARFILTWRALEADYGTPPHRDYFKWKQDPRAWRAQAEIPACSAEACPGEDDRVLIECWMGAKWGFRKFPVDPAVDFPGELAWREPEIKVEKASAAEVASMPPERVALAFDLALPLEAQLEAARRKLALLRHAQARSGKLPPLALRSGSPIWQSWLRILDGLDAGAPLAEIGSRLDLADPETAVSSARAMSAGGYRRLLMLDG